MEPSVTPWFKDGLRFKCTGCGGCCTGSPGYVYLSEFDISVLANHFQITKEEFTQKYTRFVDGRYALLERPINYDCILLDGTKCTAYEARPIQCKTFPWWIANIETPQDWEMAAARCEGINHIDAPIVPALEIETQVMTYLDNILEENFSD